MGRKKRAWMSGMRICMIWGMGMERMNTIMIIMVMRGKAA